MKYLAILALFALSSCTYTISMAHTSGTASDVIDDTSSPKADVTATATTMVGVDGIRGTTTAQFLACGSGNHGAFVQIASVTGEVSGTIVYRI